MMTVLFLTGMAKGQNGGPLLDRELAAKLIAMANQVRVPEVTVGPMLPVDQKIASTLNATSGVCVHFIAPLPESGRRVRTAQKRVLYYDEEWGWYMYSIENLRGGDGIEIVSQRKDRFMLR